MRFRLTPSALATSGSCIVPRTMSPNLVKRARTQVSTATAAVAPISMRLYIERFTPPNATFPKLVDRLRPCGPKTVVTAPTRNSERAPGGEQRIDNAPVEKLDEEPFD